MDRVRLSKFLSKVLRHRPDIISVDLDREGWASIDQIISNSMRLKGYQISLDDIVEVVANNDKQRFVIVGDKIRANQGHSIDIDLGLIPQDSVPEILYHGTDYKTLPIILKEGLRSMSRNHVHLSLDIDTALEVGKRKGDPVVLIIDANRMRHDGYKFYLSYNGVWLTDEVPSKYIEIK